ncbi:MAG: TIGR01777 family oxidoreductase [Thermodesulfobacteriaceae bacterium]|nr:TIGR01777 family oxidoreductase [Thermodesulfobacteriaceae bacterium]MDW8136147.1 TIGR01777 family oxidoreductase [Thermodesulfobacterium sp.]
MKIFLLGGTGFIGSHLVKDFLREKFEVFVLSRNPQKIGNLLPSVQIVFGDPTKEGEWQEVLNKCDFVVNLVGETIFHRWSEDYKKKIWDSRILSTRRVVEALKEGAVLFNASAVGYYGNRGEEELIEESPPGDMFVSKLCIAWEEEAFKAKEKGVRVVIGRFGIVIGPGGGMLKVVLPVFKLGLGGKLGSGKQWFSWIHIEDLSRAILFIFQKQEKGVFNITSPQPIRNHEFTKILAQALKRPAFLPVPIWVLKIFYGELAEVITASSKVIPQRLTKLGFQFRYPNFSEALKACL